MAGNLFCYILRYFILWSMAQVSLEFDYFGCSVGVVTQARCVRFSVRGIVIDDVDRKGQATVELDHYCSRVTEGT